MANHIDVIPPCSPTENLINVCLDKQYLIRFAHRCFMGAFDFEAIQATEQQFKCKVDQ